MNIGKNVFRFAENLHKERVSSLLLEPVWEGERVDDLYQPLYVHNVAET